MSAAPRPKFPPIPKDLLDALNTKFKLRSPEIGWPDRQVWIEAGTRQVVDWLAAEYARQNETVNMKVF